MLCQIFFTVAPGPYWAQTRVQSKFIFISIVDLDGFFLYLQCSIRNITTKSFRYKKGSMFSIRISGENFENLLYYFSVQTYCICHHKSNFIIVVVAKVSYVAHGPLVNLEVHNF